MSCEGPRLGADLRGRGRRAADLPQDHSLFAGQGKKPTTPFGLPAMAIRHFAEPSRTSSRTDLDEDLGLVGHILNRSVDERESLRDGVEMARSFMMLHLALRLIPVSSLVARRLCDAAN